MTTAVRLRNATSTAQSGGVTFFTPPAPFDLTARVQPARARTAQVVDRDHAGNWACTCRADSSPEPCSHQLAVQAALDLAGAVTLGKGDAAPASTEVRRR